MTCQTQAFCLITNTTSTDATQFMTGLMFPYTNVFGSFFYAMILILAMAMIYIKTQDFANTGLVGFVISVGTLPFLPVELRLVAYVFIAMSFTMVLYKLFHD